tara:strand:+ start:19044 stop:20651 length:1608 start_codon:yes stop_codon:yes gene_type:complete
MAFSGTTNSDFLKLTSIPDKKKVQYINFAGNDFFSIRDDLINYIKAIYPNDYNNFSESDLGMMLIELVSYMGAVNSLKSDMLANENYLRTVKSRSNLQKLLELIGIDLRGPTAAAAGAKLTLTTIPNANDFPLVYTAENRVFSIPSKEDGNLVNYTLYKLENNSVVDIANLAGSFQLTDSESDNAPDKTVYTNLMLLEGSVVLQKGVFDTLEGNKTISLTDSPVIDGSIEVYVDDGTGSDSTGAYKQVSRLYSSSGATDRIFQVVSDDDYGATILFGDNALGISPTAGAAFTVAYRVGGGTRGNIPTGTINVTTTLESRQSGTTLDGVTENRTAARGGNAAETAEHAKKYAPYTFKRQDRVVSLEDFIAIGNTFRSSQGTIGKTTAAVRDAYSSGNVIDVYTLEKATDQTLQKASTQFKQDLLNEIEPKKMLTDEVVVVDGLIRTLDLVVTIRIEKELKTIEGQIQQEVAEKILEFFSIDNSDFGKTFIASNLNREIFDLPNVRYATVDNLPEETKVDFNEIIQLNNFTINSVFV